MFKSRREKKPKESIRNRIKRKLKEKVIKGKGRGNLKQIKETHGIDNKGDDRIAKPKVSSLNILNRPSSGKIN